jgi:hypothetical protein
MYELLDQIRQLEIELAQALNRAKDSVALDWKKLCRGLKSIALNLSKETFMANWAVGFTMGLLTVLAAQRVIDEPQRLSCEQVRSEVLVKCTSEAGWMPYQQLCQFQWTWSRHANRWANKQQ